MKKAPKLTAKKQQRKIRHTLIFGRSRANAIYSALEKLAAIDGGIFSRVAEARPLRQKQAPNVATDSRFDWTNRRRLNRLDRLNRPSLRPA